MTHPRHERLYELFHQALERETDARSAFLDSACGGDADLREEAEQLLAEHETAPADTSAASRSALDDAPEQIGPYRILEQIGEGGMGVVYLAEQTEPVRRRVALKIIRLGMSTKQVVARFEAERQALAMMDHPNVAKVLDAGAAETGRPYFVMEHVPGVPITEHCDRLRLTIEERVGLFMLVCDAVQHAHQKGVIHRDIKPSNILVSTKDGGAVPKVIDFGVAKALHQRLTEQTFFTEQGQLIGTPEYMSPEQAEMTAQDIDTRSDIYSLGVLLYELLTGTQPFSSELLREAGFAGIQRIIREQDPPKPSTRLSSLGAESATNAGRRRADPATLTRRLRGDLDWIVMKCLEKDRARRYETPNGLAADLRRHLDHQPVEAGSPSARYRIGKLVRRNRVGVTAAALVLLVLLAGMGGTTWGLLSAIDARDAERDARAEERKRADELEQVADFQASQLGEIDVELMAVRLRADLISEAQASMERAGFGPEETAERAERLAGLLAGANLTNVALDTLDRNIFERALRAVDEQFADQPLVRARLLQTMAETLREVGLLEQATAPQIEALAVRRRVLGNEHPDTLTSVSHMGSLLQRQGRTAEAEPFLREALEGRRRVLGDEHATTLGSVNNMGSLLRSQGKLAEAEAYHREALEGYRRVLGDEHPDTLTSVSNMGFLLERQGKLAEAEPYYREALAGCRRILGDEHPDTLTSVNNMGYLLERQGKLSEAEDHLRAALAAGRRVLGDDHPQTLTSVNNMGYLLRSQGKLAEAEAYLREALAGCRRVLGDHHPDTLAAVNNLGALLRSRGKPAEAEPYYREALEGCRRVLGDEHPQTLSCVSNMGSLLQSQGKLAEAEPYYREALEVRRRVLGDEHPGTLASLNNLSALLNAQGRYAESEPRLRASVEKGERVLGADHWRVAEARSLLGECIAGQARYEEAEPLLLDGFAGLDAALPAGRRPRKLPPAIERLRRLYEAWGRPRQAADWGAKLEEPSRDGAAQQSSKADD